MSTATLEAPVEGAKGTTAVSQPDLVVRRKPQGISALDAAAIVLGRAHKPLRVKEIIERMRDGELWISPEGKTPEATLSAALTREIMTKGPKSRFRKAGRGLFGRPNRKPSK